MKAMLEKGHLALIPESQLEEFGARMWIENASFTHNAEKYMESKRIEVKQYEDNKP